MPLFSDANRTDVGVRRYSESTFSFLERSARVEAATARANLARLLECCHPQVQAQLIPRLKSDDEFQHLGAVTELVAFATLQDIACRIEVEPSDSGARPIRPDFRVTEYSDRYYLEATLSEDTPQAARKDEARKATIYDIINKLEIADFMVGVDIDGVTEKQPSAKKITEFLKKQLASVDYAQLVELGKKSGLKAMPRWAYKVDGLSLTFYPIPKRQEFRGATGEPIGVMMHGVYTVNTHHALREDLCVKAGELRGIESPLVIAVNLHGKVVDDRVVKQALYGDEEVTFTIGSGHVEQTTRPNGVWSSATGPRNQHLSGVIVLPRLSAFNIGAVDARLYINPWASRPLKSQLTNLSRVELSGNRLTEYPGKEFHRILS